MKTVTRIIATLVVAMVCIVSISEARTEASETLSAANCAIGTMSDVTYKKDNHLVGGQTK